MIGPILLLVSWGLLRLQGKGISVLGFNFPRRRLGEFAVGFLITGSAAALQQLGLAWASGDAWQLNEGLTGELVVQHLRWALNSVLYEELLFRGYLLYQAIQLLGARRGIWLSALAFGIYHWFTFGVIPHLIAMAYVLLLTGAFGGMCALAFVKTKSVFAPIGLHLGWNLVSYVVFSAGPAGAALLVPGSGVARMKASGLAGFGLGFGLQLLLATVVMVGLFRVRSDAAERGSN